MNIEKHNQLPYNQCYKSVRTFRLKQSKVVMVIQTEYSTGFSERKSWLKAQFIQTHSIQFNDETKYPYLTNNLERC